MDQLVSHGTTLNMDGWAAYGPSKDHWFLERGIECQRVNHSKEFVSKKGGCSNSMESSWRWFDEVLPTPYPSTKDFPGYIGFYAFLKKFRHYTQIEKSMKSKFLCALDEITDYKMNVNNGLIDPVKNWNDYLELGKSKMTEEQKNLYAKRHEIPTTHRVTRSLADSGADAIKLAVAQSATDEEILRSEAGGNTNVEAGEFFNYLHSTFFILLTFLFF